MMLDYKFGIANNCATLLLKIVAIFLAIKLLKSGFIHITINKDNTNEK